MSKRRAMNPRIVKVRRGQRGYALLVVLILMMILLGAGVYSLSAFDADIKATAKFRQSEQLTKGAEAGAAHRLSEIAQTLEPIAILSGQSDATGAWNLWPPVGVFTATSDMDGTLRYRTTPSRFVWKGKVPPPGVAVGTNTYIFEVESYATSGTNAFDGEATITVGFKTWDLLPSSYGP